MSRLIQEITVNEEEQEQTFDQGCQCRSSQTAFRNSPQRLLANNSNNNTFIYKGRRKSLLYFTMAMATAEVCQRREVLGECKDTSLPFTRVDVRVNAATQFEYHRSGIGRGGVEQVRRKGLGIKQVLLFYFFASMQQLWAERQTEPSECSAVKMQFECKITNRFDFIAFNAARRTISLVNSKSSSCPPPYPAEPSRCHW